MTNRRQIVVWPLALAITCLLHKQVVEASWASSSSSRCCTSSSKSESRIRHRGTRPLRDGWYSSTFLTYGSMRNPCASLCQMTATNSRLTDTGQSSSSSSSSSSSEPYSHDSHSETHNILEDATGHVNRELADRIWNWEQECRREKDLPKVNYSVRAGLRLVDSMVEDILRGRNSDKRSNVYGDLIQEGLFTLLDAMSNYRDDEHTEDFETYARQEIYQHLAQSLDEEARPIRLPKGVKAVVKEATRLMALQVEQSGHRPTLAQVAAKLNLPVGRLQDYLRLARAAYRSTLSMESTVEILNPLLDDSTPAYRDQEEWELREGLLLDNGRSDHRDELVDEYLDETLQREGDDEAWVQQEQIAGRLQDLIPDLDESSLDDLILEELIRTDLSQFLSSTLEPHEIEVIRLCFGLDSGKALSVEEAAKELGKPVSVVSKLLAESLEELRAVYSERYVEPGGSDHIEDSV